MLKCDKLEGGSYKIMGRRATFLSDEKSQGLKQHQPRAEDTHFQTEQQHLGNRMSLFRAISQWILICLTMVIGLTFLLEILDGKASLSYKASSTKSNE